LGVARIRQFNRKRLNSFSLDTSNAQKYPSLEDTSMMNPSYVESKKADILIVDDIPENLNALSRTLESFGYNVIAAPGGELALTIATKTPPDLILLDIMMPGIDGYETCRRLKAGPETAEIPLLAVHFLEMFANEMRIEPPDLTLEAIKALEAHHFPGNVRELKNIIEGALIKSRGQAIEPEHLHFIGTPMTNARPQEPAATESLIPAIIAEGRGYSEAVEHFQRQLVSQTLAECDGNRHEAARRLSIDRGNLRRLMKRLGIT
jgi:DNA-binding NtrC family response regulator